ncbi:DUF1479-domain-containing protein [Xylaria nigripes]|nr:DUF1479-domain-containing protein [Xylaria nigripes]
MATEYMMPILNAAEPIPLSPRFAKLKRNMIACREKDVAESFYRLIRALRTETNDIAARGSDVIPTIDYIDIDDSEKASAFRETLKKRGVGIIKRVVPFTVAGTWKEETLDYIADNPQTKRNPLQDPRLFNLYWSPSQVRARADSRLLDAQRFAMGTWHASDEDAHVSGEYPVVYADRLRIRMPDDIGCGGTAHVDNGSAERWEPDGYGASGTYSSIFSGSWEDYDPWDSTPRIHITTDLYNRFGSCSMFRMFQGFLSLSAIPAGSGSLSVCPMLQLSTAYLLLRPFFTPRHSDPTAKTTDSETATIAGTEKITESDYLHPNNWNLNVSQTSVLHGAIPGYVQEVNNTLHPHLQLDRTLVPLPDIEPGDYVIWHPDAVHAVNAPSNHQAATSSSSPSLNPNSNFDASCNFNQNMFSPFSLDPSSDYPFPNSPGSSSPFPHQSDPCLTTITSNNMNTSPPTPQSSSIPTNPNQNPNPTDRKNTTAILYIPACPLTQTNALYLSRQRRAFLLGLPAPDFAEAGRASTGERDHAGRSNVQDVADAGGDEGLRSMGLTPWEELRRHSHDGEGSRKREKDARLLEFANGILFPDRYDGVLKTRGESMRV